MFFSWSHQSEKLCYDELGGGRTLFFFHAPLLLLQLSLFKKWLEVCMGGFEGLGFAFLILSFCLYVGICMWPFCWFRYYILAYLHLVSGLFYIFKIEHFNILNRT